MSAHATYVPTPCIAARRRAGFFTDSLSKAELVTRFGGHPGEELRQRRPNNGDAGR